MTKTVDSQQSRHDFKHTNQGKANEKLVLETVKYLAEGCCDRSNDIRWTFKGNQLAMQVTCV